MFLLPYRKYRITTQLTVNEIVSRIRRITSPVDWLISLWPPDDRKEFRGKVSESGFRIVRNIEGRNSMVPVIRGRFESSGNQTEIIITMYQHPVASVFMSVIMIPMLVAFPITLFVILLYLLMYAFGFVPEKTKAEELIAKALSLDNKTAGRSL